MLVLHITACVQTYVHTLNSTYSTFTADAWVTHIPKETEIVLLRGVKDPLCRVISSTFPADVTAASTVTASPPSPLCPLGWFKSPAQPAPTGTGHTEKVVTLCGRVCSSPRRAGLARAAGSCPGEAALAGGDWGGAEVGVGALGGGRKPCKGTFHCQTWPSSDTVMTRSDSWSSF